MSYQKHKIVLYVLCTHHKTIFIQQQKKEYFVPLFCPTQYFVHAFSYDANNVHRTYIESLYVRLKKAQKTIFIT
jgi:hypothetical protein